MSDVQVWPVVLREDIVRAYSPSAPATKESPFRALRDKGSVSAGVGIPQRRDGRLAGKLNVFCSLNVDAARFMSRGDLAAGRLVAETAQAIEAGASFQRFASLLQRLSTAEQQSVIGGQLPQGDDAAQLQAALRSLAEETAAALERIKLRCLDDRFAGRVTERRDDSVLVSAADGSQTAAPLWMVSAVHRDQVGDRVVLVSVRLDDHQALVRAVPGIEIPSPRTEPGAEPDFSPFGRRDRRTVEVSESDLKQLRGQPAPLRVLIPVTVER